MARSHTIGLLLSLLSLISISGTFSDVPQESAAPTNGCSGQIITLFLVDDNCNYLPSQLWPMDKPLRLIGSENSCCSHFCVDGCVERNLAASFFGLSGQIINESGEALLGEFSTSDEQCNEQLVMTYSEILTPGAYFLTYQGEEVEPVPFTIVETSTVTPVPLPVLTPTPTPLPPTTFDGRVWHDANENGVQEIEESGISDVQISVVGYCVFLDPPELGEERLGSSITDEGGYYSLQIVENTHDAAGYPIRLKEVRVRFEVEGDFTSAYQGADPLLDSDVDDSGEARSGFALLPIGTMNSGINAGVLPNIHKRGYFPFVPH